MQLVLDFDCDAVEYVPGADVPSFEDTQAYHAWAVEKFNNGEFELLHREMWRFLAETGADDKEEWPGWGETFDDYIDIACNCFCCHVAGGEHCRDCDDCPITWPFVDNCADVKCLSSLFGIWENIESKEVRKRIAKVIMQLPWDEPAE